MPNLFTGNPGITLNFDDPLNSIDDSYRIALATAKTGTLTQDGLLIDANVDITGGNVSLAGSGVTLNLSDQNLAVDDEITVNLTIDKTVKVELDNVHQGTFGLVADTLDLSAALGVDVGFDIAVTNAIDGRNDEFTFALTRDHELSAIADTNLIGIDQRTIKAGDLFTADVDAGTLELGSEFNLDVDGPTLEVGKEYVDPRTCRHFGPWRRD